MDAKKKLRTGKILLPNGEVTTIEMEESIWEQRDALLKKFTESEITQYIEKSSAALNEEFHKFYPEGIGYAEEFMKSPNVNVTRIVLMPRGRKGLLTMSEVQWGHYDFLIPTIKETWLVDEIEKLRLQMKDEIDFISFYEDGMNMVRYHLGEANRRHKAGLL